MDPNIILGGQGVNALGAIADANQAAGQQKAYQAANALAPVVQAQQEANLRQTNALAPYDVPLAQAELAFKQQQLQTLKQQAMTQAAEQASRMTAAQITAERDQQTRILKGASVLYAKQDRKGFEEFLKMNGVDPATMPFDHFDSIMAMADGVLEVYNKFAPPPPAQPQSSAGKLEADYRAGLIPPEVYQAEIAATGKPAVQVNMGGDNKQIFTAMTESRTAAQAAKTGLAAIQEARGALEGGIISGAGADMRLGLQKVGALIGADASKIVNTETFRSAIAPQVAALMKATVGSQQISNADRDFAEKAAGGSISLDGASIARLLDIMERANRAIIENHLSTLDAVYPAEGGFTQERAILGMGLEMPQQPQQAPQQAPQQPAQPNMAQPQDGPQPGVTEDGYRFLGGDPGDPNNWEKVR